MLQQISIENFKSLKKVTLDLRQVNLLIGANNSGKSNFFKALLFFKSLLGKTSISKEELKDLFFRTADSDSKIDFPIVFDIRKKTPEGIVIYKAEVYPSDNRFPFRFNEFSAFVRKDADIEDFRITDLAFLKKNFPYFDVVYNHALPPFGDNSQFVAHNLTNERYSRLECREGKFTHFSPGDRHSIFGALLKIDSDHDLLNILQALSETRLYKPDVQRAQEPTIPKPTEQIDESCSNVTSFIFSLGQNHRNKLEQLEADLLRCTGEFNQIATPPVSDNYLRLKLFDERAIGFWSSEVSEGVLFFLAILCIVHQPNPPKIILFEEPDRGIHPRRIKEIISFMRQLADEKGVQFIISSHHPIVLDEFANDPSSVFVFDKVEGATLIRNLETDIIQERNKKFSEAGLSTIDYTDTLSENWLMGLLDGVPHD